MMLIYFIVLLIAVPVLTALLMGWRPALPKKKKPADPSPYTYEALLQTLQRANVIVEREYIADEDDDESHKMIEFRFQGGTFHAVYDTVHGDERRDTTALFFPACFQAEPQYLSTLFHAVNDLAGIPHPIRLHIIPSEDNKALLVTAAAYGLRVSDRPEDTLYLQEMLMSFFQVRQIISEKFDEVLAESPNMLMDVYMPRWRTAYAIARAQLDEDTPGTLNSVWYKLPPYTLSNIVDSLFGFRPSDKAGIYVNGAKSADDADAVMPFRLMLDDDLKALKPIKQDHLSVDIIEPDHVTHRDVHIMFKVEEVAERLITVRLYATFTGLAVTQFRPEQSPDTHPGAVTTVIGLHRQGEESFRAEAEYMSQEQGMLDSLRYVDVAAAFYWGKILFAQDRWLEAVHFLESAFHGLYEEMSSPKDTPEEVTEQFLEMCYFLALCYYKLKRPRDAYYYIDFIFGQHRVKWTELFLLILTQLHDPRTYHVMKNIKDGLNLEPDEDGEVPEASREIAQFIEQQTVVMKHIDGRDDEVRKTLEGILAIDPDDQFALQWLSRLQ